MKVIFLDFDGVINCAMSYMRNWGPHPNWLEWSKAHEIEAEIEGVQWPFEGPVGYAIQYLNELIEETGAKIVVSSTWRMFGAEECQKTLTFEGVKGEVIDVTNYADQFVDKTVIKEPFRLMDYEQDYVRGHQIEDWLRRHPEVEKYVIIDDDADMLDKQQPYFVHVDNDYGFARKDFTKAKKILNS